mmetsp:Transcript_5776/g.17379  ORF Transcript_5776/g.17379 Transcript_5776/m.17379 type:complete len:224 (+) Transcript_5776:157-828(+)
MLSNESPSNADQPGAAVMPFPGHAEVEAAATAIASFLAAAGEAEAAIAAFRQALARGLAAKYQSHWWTEEPQRGEVSIPSLLGHPIRLSVGLLPFRVVSRCRSTLPAQLPPSPPPTPLVLLFRVHVRFRHNCGLRVFGTFHEGVSLAFDAMLDNGGGNPPPRAALPDVLPAWLRSPHLQSPPAPRRDGSPSPPPCPGLSEARHVSHVRAIVVPAARLSCPDRC